jgi:hypothetical protein
MASSSKITARGCPVSFGEIHLLDSPCTRWLLTGLPFRCACASLFREGIEMLRKLTLSVVGAFFTSKSTMSVASAMLISILFYGLHTRIYPVS